MCRTCLFLEDKILILRSGKNILLANTSLHLNGIVAGSLVLKYILFRLVTNRLFVSRSAIEIVEVWSSCLGGGYLSSWLLSSDSYFGWACMLPYRHWSPFEERVVVVFSRLSCARQIGGLMPWFIGFLVTSCIFSFWRLNYLHLMQA